MSEFFNPLPEKNRKVVYLEDQPTVCVERTREEGQDFAKVECDWQVAMVSGDKVIVVKEDKKVPGHAWRKPVELTDLQKWNLHLDIKRQKEDDKAA